MEKVKLISLAATLLLYITTLPPLVRLRTDGRPLPSVSPKPRLKKYTAEAMLASGVVVAVLFVEVLPAFAQELATTRGAAPAATGPLRKTVVSSKMRLAIAVGLEGTGHDYGEFQGLVTCQTRNP